MGCLRMGFALFTSLIALAVCIIVGTLFGAIIPVFLSGGIQNMNISSPLSLLEANSQGALIGGGIGALLGLFIMARTVKRASDVNWLKTHGTRVTATVKDIKRKTGSRQVSYSTGNGMQYRTETYTYYVLTANWFNPYTRNTQTFTSDNLTFNPRKYAPGSPISVLIDPQNPGRYLVEV